MRHKLPRLLSRAAFSVCVFSLCVAVCEAAIEPGERIGPLTLTTLDGPRFVMNNYHKRIGTVIAFISARCPATDALAKRINYIQEEYRHKRILWVGIGANPAESGDELRDFCQKRGMIFPVYLDPNGKIRNRFGATVTPEVFLLDARSEVVYYGAIGANKSTGLEAAIRAVRNGKKPAVTHVPPKGTPIDSPKPKRQIGDPYGKPAFSSELVFEKIDGAVAFHCSTLTETPGGDLLCLWYGGSYEASDDQKLFLARRKKGSRIWEKPEIIVSNPLQPPGNAVIFTDGIGRIWIVWGRKEGDRPRRRGSGGPGRLMFRTSTDEGKTWSDDRALVDELGWGVRNVPVKLSSGELALPVGRSKLHGTKNLYIMTTPDNGKTWRRSAPFHGGSQPTLIERDDGALFVMMRHKPTIMQTVSCDGGRSWAEPVKSVFPNPDAGIAMTKLKNGHVLLVFNNTDDGRTPLNIARSLDGGRTWERPLTLEANPGEYSYPCVIQTSDGRIHISYTFRRYTIKHVEMNEDWMAHLKRPN